MIFHPLAESDSLNVQSHSDIDTIDNTTNDGVGDEGVTGREKSPDSTKEEPSSTFTEEDVTIRYFISLCLVLGFRVN